MKQKKYLREYAYHAVRVIISATYFFALSEIYSRPILNGLEPLNTTINPFP